MQIQRVEIVGPELDRLNLASPVNRGGQHAEFCGAGEEQTRQRRVEGSSSLWYMTASQQVVELRRNF